MTGTDDRFGLTQGRTAVPGAAESTFAVSSAGSTRMVAVTPARKVLRWR